MEDRKYNVEIVEVTIYQVEHEIRFWKLEGRGKGLGKR